MNSVVVRFISSLLVCIGLLLTSATAQAQHIHLGAGAVSTAPGAKLFFYNGWQYDINSWGGITPACFFMSTNDALYPNLFQTDVSFIALPGTLWTGGPQPYAAEQGAYIEMRFISVQGPPGGEISLWVENEDATQTTKRFSLPVGTEYSTNQINLSEGITEPELDPFGHIHGRRFTANEPGLYTVGVQLIDTSNLDGGGPRHSPSDTNYFYFQAGLFIDSITKSNEVVSVRFGSRGFKNYYLEATTNLMGSSWLTLGEVIGGNHSDLHYLVDTNATGSMKFYRIREEAQ